MNLSKIIYACDKCWMLAPQGSMCRCQLGQNGGQNWYGVSFDNSAISETVYQELFSRRPLGQRSFRNISRSTYRDWVNEYINRRSATTAINNPTQSTRSYWEGEEISNAPEAWRVEVDEFGMRRTVRVTEDE